MSACDNVSHNMEDRVQITLVGLPRDVFDSIATHLDFSSFLSLSSTCTTIRRRLSISYIPTQDVHKTCPVVYKKIEEDDNRRMTPWFQKQIVPRLRPLIDEVVCFSTNDIMTLLAQTQTKLRLQLRSKHPLGRYQPFVHRIASVHLHHYEFKEDGKCLEILSLIPEVRLSRCAFDMEDAGALAHYGKLERLHLEFSCSSRTRQRKTRLPALREITFSLCQFYVSSVTGIVDLDVGNLFETNLDQPHYRALGQAIYQIPGKLSLQDIHSDYIRPWTQQPLHCKALYLELDERIELAGVTQLEELCVESTTLSCPDVGRNLRVLRLIQSRPMVNTFTNDMFPALEVMEVELLSNVHLADLSFVGLARLHTLALMTTHHMQIRVCSNPRLSHFAISPQTWLFECQDNPCLQEITIHYTTRNPPPEETDESFRACLSRYRDFFHLTPIIVTQKSGYMTSQILQRVFFRNRVTCSQTPLNAAVPLFRQVSFD